MQGKRSPHRAFEERSANRRYLRSIAISDRVMRYSVAAFTLGFGGLGLATALARDGAGDDPVRAAIMLAASATTIPVAVVVAITPIGPIWWNKSSSTWISTAFVAYADVGLATVLLCITDRPAALNGAVLFALIGAYASHFVPTRAACVHVVAATCVIAVLAARLLHAGAPVSTVFIEGVMMIFGANGVVLLHAWYTDEVQRSLRTALTAATRDSLTGVLNRREFEVRAAEFLAEGHGTFAVAIVDADTFKSVNDRFGHFIGDAVLRGLSEALEEAFVDSIVARLGGDEFAIAGTQAELMRNITHIVDSAVITLPTGEVITVSAGVSVDWIGATPPMSSRRALLRRMLEESDRALLEAKRLGGHRTVLLTRG